MPNSDVNFWRRDSRSYLELESHCTTNLTGKKIQSVSPTPTKNLHRESLQRSRLRAMSICYLSKWIQIAQLEKEKPKNTLASSLSRMDPITIIFSIWSYMHYYKSCSLRWVSIISLRTSTLMAHNKSSGLIHRL